MAFPRSVKELCTPAYLYFVVSMIGLIMAVIQNIGNTRTYNLGSLTARVSSTTLVFIVKLIYILFWSWILNMIFKYCHSGIAGFLVLVPFVLLFIIMGLVMGDSRFEGMVSKAIKKTTK